MTIFQKGRISLNFSHFVAIFTKFAENELNVNY